jgi:transposase-like protein
MEKKTQEGAPEGAEGSKRRRRYSAQEKLRMVDECEASSSRSSGMPWTLWLGDWW